MNPLPLFHATSGALPLLGALVVGFGFGFVLERAGFGRAPKLAAQFYGYDMTVFKVMFTAIVTAMLGVVILGELRWLDARALAVAATSETFLWPMLIGGFVLGAGFIISGYCPGTSIVAMASGHVDGLVTVAGVIVGSVAYSEAFPLFARFHESGAKGHFFLYDWLRVAPAVVAVVIALVALVLFVGVVRLERVLAPRFAAVRCDDPGEAPARRRGAFAAVGVAAAMAVAFLFVPAEPRARAAAARSITAEQLADRVFAAPWTLRILDLRTEAECAKARVPGSECVPVPRLAGLNLADGASNRDLVLVASKELPNVPPDAAGYGGRIFVLRGGFVAWSAHAARTGLDRSVGAAPAGAPIGVVGGGASPRKKHGGGGCQ
jgi:hypothetical protein